MDVKVGFALGLIGTIVSNAGLALLKRGADQVSRLTLRLRWSVIKEFMRCRIWVVGTMMQAVSFGFYLGALALAPVSVAQPVISSGIIVLVFLAIVYLKEHTTATEKVLIALVIVGLPVLGASLEATPESTGPVPHAGLAAFSLACLAGAAVVTVLMRQGHRDMDWGVGLGLLSGTFGGVAMLAAKGMTVVIEREGFGTVQTPIYIVLVLATNTAFYALLQAGFQRGRAMTVVPVMAGVSGVLPVLGGFWVFSEALPSGWRMTARVAGTVMILVGSIGLSRFGEGPAPAPAPIADVVAVAAVGEAEPS